MSPIPQHARRQQGSTRAALLAGCVALAALIASLFAIGWPLRVSVDSPRLGSPWIDHPQGVMSLRLDSSIPRLLPRMSLSLEGPGGAAALTLLEQHWEADDAVLSLRLPGLPDGSYALRVRTAHQDTLVPRAVFLRRDWPHRLRLVQVADLPPPGRESLMARFIAEMRTRAPDAVLVTGDINYGGTESNINLIYSELAKLEIPVIMTAGNHEREAWHRYLRVFDARDQRTDFGPLRIISLDSAHGRDALTPQTFGWLKAQLASAGGRTTIIQLHHPVFPPGPRASSEAGGTGGYLRGMRRSFLELCRQYHVSLVLGGHWHQDAVFDGDGNFRNDRADFPGTKFVVTTALGAQAREVYSQVPVRNGYRWIEFQDGQLQGYSPDAHNPVPSTPLGAP